MIKFFRNIRKKLLTEGKTSRYLTYAVGEIILVVIGILIALQINNWNEERKNDQSGRDLLVRLHRDLVQDTLHFRSVIQENNVLREEIKGFLITLYEGVQNKNQVYALSATYDKALDQVFSPHDNTYKSMESAGTLGLIPDEAIREALLDHYGSYDKIGSLLASINDWMLGVATELDLKTDFLKFTALNVDIYTRDEMLSEKDYRFLKDPDDPGFKLLVRAISATAFNQRVRNGYYDQLIEDCDRLLKQIDQELATQ